MNFSDFRISTRLRAGFCTVLGFSLLLAVVAWVQLQKVGDIAADINDSQMVSAVDLNEIRDVIADVRRSELRDAIVATGAERDKDDQVRDDI